MKTYTLNEHNHHADKAGATRQTGSVVRSVLCGLALFMSVARPPACSAQGIFQNLDFESPDASALTNLFVPFADAFPGWSGYIGTSTNPVSVAGYNFVSGGSALVTLISLTATPPTPQSVIEGNYTATIAAGLAGPTGVLTSASIAQVGTVPISAQSLRFLASGGTYLSVTFNGTNIPFIEVGTGPNYHEFAGDVTALEGFTGELRFTTVAAPIEPVTILDSIQFSSLAVPEPTPAALMICAAALAFWRIRAALSAPNRAGDSGRESPPQGLRE